MTAPAPQPGTPPARGAVRPAALAFPAALWAFATCFLLFQLGKWNDDWWFSGRDPASGRIVELTKVQGSPCWRPLHHIFTPSIITLLWNHDWAVHLIAAAVHGGCSLLVWRVLRSLGASPLAAAAGGLLFLCYPGHFEPVFWFAATSTAIATGVFLLLTLMYIRYASGRGSWPALGAMFLVALAVPCFNEQPLAGIAAWPLAWPFLTRARTNRPARSGSAARHFARMAAPLVVCGLAGAVYIAANVATLPANFAGGANSFTPLEGLAARAAQVAGGMRDILLMSRFRLGALLEGSRAIGERPVAAVAWAFFLLGTGVAWLTAHRRRSASPADPDSLVASIDARGHAVRSILLACFGLAVFFADWLPLIAVEGYPVRSRMLYAPAAGLAIAIAGCIDAAAAWLAPRSPMAAPRSGACAAAVIGACALLGAVTMVGIQRAFAERWLADRAEGAALRAAVPNPPPGSVFLPVKIEGTTLRSGSTRFDEYFAGPWELSWAAPNFVRFLYGRADLHGLWFSRWGRNIRAADTEGFTFVDPLPAAFRQFQDRAGFVPWARAVPFEIDANGRITAGPSVILRTPGAPERKVPLEGPPGESSVVIETP